MKDSQTTKLPAIQFYVGDWRKDAGVQSLSFHDRGIWFEILCFMHESEERGKLMLNGQPMSEDALARLLGLVKQNLTSTLTTLLESGVASRDPATGALVCRRMVKDEALRQIRKNIGKLGGNPKLLVNQIPTTGVNQKSTPSSSVSTSSSPSGKEHERESGGDFVERPAWTEVWCHAQRIGLAEWKAQDWFDEMEGCGWMDYNHRPIAKWQFVLMRVCRKWEADGRPAHPPSNQSQQRQQGAGIRPPSVMDLKTAITIKEEAAKNIKNKYCSEVAMGDSWNNDEKRQEFFAIKSEIKGLKARIEKMV